VDEAARTSGSEVDEQEQRSPEEIRRDIEETREDLGDTVEALAQKADVKGQAKAKFEGIKQSAQEKTQQFTSKAKDASPDSASAGAEQVTALAKENPIPAAAVGAFAAGLLVGWILSR
jgi:ElaB/YqjD/DUF883 family membrane-anchored ribosome-binding protein